MITINPDAVISGLAHLLMRFKISGVPVITKDEGIVGIVTATDLFEIMKKIIGEGEKGLESVNNKIFVKDIMTGDIFSVSEDATLFEIIKLMCNKNIHTLPVVSNKEIVGVIGRRDVLNAFYALGELTDG